MGFRNGSKPGNEVMDEAKNGFRHSEANIPSFSAELQKEATHAVLELRADGSTSPLENLSSRRLYTYIKHVVSAFDRSTPVLPHGRASPVERCVNSCSDATVQQAG